MGQNTKTIIDFFAITKMDLKMI